MKTLRSKLLLAMLSIALIITVLLSLVSVYFINVSAKDTLKSTAEPLAVQAAKNFDSTISSYTNNIVSTVKSDSFLGAKTDADRLKAVKVALQTTQAFYLNFTVFLTAMALCLQQIMKWYRHQLKKARHKRLRKKLGLHNRYIYLWR